MTQPNKLGPDVPKLTLTEMLLRTPIGETFYTEVKDTVVGSYAARAGVKAQTERLLCIHAARRELRDIVRVTIVSRDSSVMPTKAKTVARAAETVRTRRTRTA